MSEKAETINKKKNGAHTNSCTTVQLDERNIHVGCCLFSHNKNKCKQNKKKQRDVYVCNSLYVLFAFCELL